MTDVPSTAATGMENADKSSERHLACPLVSKDINSPKKSQVDSVTAVCENCTLTCNVVSKTTSFELVGTMS